MTRSSSVSIGFEGDGAEIRLSPELDFVERKLCKLQQTLERRESAARQSEQRKNDLVITRRMTSKRR